MNINNDEMKIKIGADTSDFEKKTKEIVKDFEDMAKKGDKSIDKISDSFEKSADKVEKETKDMAKQAEKALFNIADDSKKATGKMEDDFKDYADTVKKKMDESKRAGKDSAKSMVESQEKVKKELFAVAQAAKDSGRDVEKAFDEAASKLPREMQGAVADMKRELQSMESVAKTAAKNTESAFKDVGSGISKAGTALTAGAAAGIAGGTALAIGANNKKQQQNNLQVALGLNDADSKKAFAVANNLYKDGLGENMEEVNQALITTKQNLQDLNDVDLEKVTKFSLTMEKSFGQDAQETTRTMATLMKQFGINAEDAMDIITYGFQNGLNKNGDYLDSLNEYSSYFKIIGQDAQGMVSILKKAKDEGVWSMDKAGDLVKEGTLSLRNIGSAEQDGINTIYGLDTSDKNKEKNAKFYKQIQDDINAGGTVAANRLDDIVKRLGQLSEAKRYTAGVSIFKTQWEDVGSDIAMQMLQVQDAVEGIGGSSKKAVDKASDNFTVRLAKITREFKDELQPLGESLLDLGEEALPIITKWAGVLADNIEDLTKWFDGLSDSQKELVVKMGLIVGAAGPVLLIVGKIASSLGVLKNVIGMSSSAGAVGAFGALSKGIGGVSTALLPIVGTLTTVAGIFAAIEKFAPESPMTEAEKMANKFEESMKKIRGEWDKTNESINNKTLDLTMDTKLGKKADKDKVNSLSGDITTKADISVKELKRSKRNEISRISDMKNDKEFYSQNKDLVDGLAAESKNTIAKIDKDIQSIRKLENEAKKGLSEGIDKNGKLSEEALNNASSAQAKIAEISAGYMKDVNNRSMEEMVAHQDEMKANQDQYIIDSVGKAQSEYEQKKALADELYNKSVETARHLYEDLGTIDGEEYKNRVDAAQTRKDQIVGEAQQTKDEYIATLEGMVGKVDGIVNTSTGKLNKLYEVTKLAEKGLGELAKPLSWAVDKAGHLGETLGKYMGLDPKDFKNIPKRDASNISSDMKSISNAAGSLVHTPLKFAVNIGGELAGLVNKVTTEIHGKTKKKSSYRTNNL